MLCPKLQLFGFLVLLKGVPFIFTCQVFTVQSGLTGMLACLTNFYIFHAKRTELMEDQRRLPMYICTLAILQMQKRKGGHWGEVLFHQYRILGYRALIVSSYEDHI